MESLLEAEDVFRDDQMETPAIHGKPAPPTGPELTDVAAPTEVVDEAVEPASVAVSGSLPLEDSPSAPSSAPAEGTPAASTFNELLSSKIKFVKTPLQSKPDAQTTDGAQASKEAGKVVFRMAELRQMGKAMVRKEGTWPTVLAAQYQECVFWQNSSTFPLPFF